MSYWASFLPWRVLIFQRNKQFKGYQQQFWKTEWRCSASRVVAIIFTNNFQYSVHSEPKDPKGNFIILDVSTQEQRISLVALYGPNEGSPNFFQNLKSKLVSPSDTSIMIGGDWNVVQNLSFDTDNYLHKNSLKSHDKVLEISIYPDLIDVWRKCTERRDALLGMIQTESRVD